MKRLFIAVLALTGVVMVTASCGRTSKISHGNPARMDSLSYCIGMDLSNSVKSQFADVPFDFGLFENGFREGATKSAKQSMDEATEVCREFFSISLQERRASIAKYNEDSTSTDKGPAPQIFANDDEKAEISYAYGNFFGTSLSNGDLAIELFWLMKGFNDSNDGSTEITKENGMKFLQRYFTVVVPAENAKLSEKWLKKMSRKCGVQKTESGLLYKVIKSGDMEKAATSLEDTVEVHYVGKKRDGKVFDASRYKNWPEERKAMVKEHRPDLFDEDGNFTDEKPIKFPLNRVIKGWGEGVQLIGPGGVIKLYIPSELAYGARGPREIGPNEALEFEVEVIAVYPAAKKEAEAEKEAETTEESKKAIEEVAKKAVEKAAKKAAKK